MRIPKNLGSIDKRKDTEMSESKASMAISSPYKLAAKISNSDLPNFDDIIKFQSEIEAATASPEPKDQINKLNQFYQTRVESRKDMKKH